MQPMPPDPTLVPLLTSATIARLVAEYPDAPAPVHRETPEEAAERAAKAAAYRARVWAPDPKYADASYASLTAAEDPGGKVTGWWQHGGYNLVIRSQVNGNGKSHAAHAIGNEVVKAGGLAATWSVSRLNADLRPGGNEAAFDLACTVDLLVLDDLGAEKITDWTLERLGDLLDVRTRVRRTIFTTNLTGDQAHERYDDRIMSRLMDGATFVEFTGPSWRKVNPW